MDRKKIYNPNSKERTADRKIFGGEPTGIFELNDIKYQWAYNLWEVMLNNTWFPKEVDMTQDVSDYKRLTDSEKMAYDKVLAQLIFMDSLQTNNLIDNVNPFITSPEINLILVRQAFEEALHSQSYAVMVDSISQNSDEIYQLWRKDMKLKSKNDTIARVYENLSQNPTDENIVKAMFANQILEGIYFYSGFTYLYTLARSGKMLGSAQMIRFIQRDEVCVHPDTQLLTANGWKNIADISTEDFIAQYDMENEEITFEKPLHKTWRDYKGSMFKLVDNRGKVLQNISKGHDLVIKSRSSKSDKITIKKEKVEEAKFNGYKFIPSSGYGVGKDKTLTELEKLLIAIQADGTIDKERRGKITGKQAIHIGLKKDRKKERLISILKNGNFEYREYEDTRDEFKNFYIKIDNTLQIDKNFDWVDLTKISSNWGKEFLNELTFWDGHRPKDRDSFYFSTTNKKAFEKVLSIASLSGVKFKSNIEKDDRKESYLDIYRLTWWIDTNNLQTQSLEKVEYQYEGKIGCVTMPKGTIITKYDNQVSITGNCHLVLFQNMIKSTKRERPELFTKELLDEVYNMFREAVELESSWGKYITNGQILGLTDNIIEQYIQYLADERLKAVGMEKLYNVAHPIKWVDNFSSFNDQKTNFFEGNVTNYSKGSLDLDDF